MIFHDIYVYILYTGKFDITYHVWSVQIMFLWDSILEALGFSETCLFPPDHPICWLITVHSFFLGYSFIPVALVIISLL